MEARSIKVSRLERKEFKEVLKKGRRFREDLLVAKILFEEERKIKIGILISKRISPKATKRNLLKRRIREIVRTLPQIQKGFKIVFIPLPGIDFDFESLKRKIERILKKARILK